MNIKNEMPLVSIVIVNYNGLEHLHECLTSIEKIDYKNYELIFVDNNSKDNSINYVNKNFQWINIISLNKNYGFAEGSNIGAKYSKGEYIVFLNNDTKVDKKWLSELVKEMIKDDSIATCGSKIYFYENNVINHAGSAITLLGNGYDIGFGQKDSTSFNEKKFVGSTCGGSMMIRKNVFNLLGGFDPNYFACCEDVDLCLRSWISGYKNLYVPASIIYHKYGGTLGKRQSANRVYMCQKNRLINILKNFELSNIIKGFMISIPYDTVRFISFIIKKERKIAFSLVKAYIEIFLMREKILQKRKIVQKNRKISDRRLIRIGVITSLTEGIKEFVRLNNTV